VHQINSIYIIIKEMLSNKIFVLETVKNNNQNKKSTSKGIILYAQFKIGLYLFNKHKKLENVSICQSFMNF